MPVLTPIRPSVPFYHLLCTPGLGSKTSSVVSVARWPPGAPARPWPLRENTCSTSDRSGPSSLCELQPGLLPGPVLHSTPSQGPHFMCTQALVWSLLWGTQPLTVGFKSGAGKLSTLEPGVNRNHKKGSESTCWSEPSSFAHIPHSGSLHFITEFSPWRLATIYRENLQEAH